MKTHTHEEVALCAHTLWQDSGRIEGRDLANWLDAERGLAVQEETPAPAASSDHAAHIPGHTPLECAQSEIAATQRAEARSPIEPRKSAPHTKPPESGKPIWDKPHSR